ncbi:4'-phosphopantetheinyl transferase superfamily protein [Eubacteriaceae bacterium ES2]|nr:4'-phosphopantetheinyl transferase superfamily protein [Eubacteriaceae bacterium ES2]
MENALIQNPHLKTEPRLLSISEMETGTDQDYHYDPDQCHLFLLKNTPFQNDLVFNRCYKLLPDVRQEKINRLRNRNDQNASLAAGLLLHHLLTTHGYCESDLSYNQYGKPYLDTISEFYVNLSHCSDLAVCAFFSSEVGVDAEKFESADLGIAKHYFTSRERNQILTSTDPIRYFYDYWVLKESYLKAKGIGLNMALDEFEIIVEKKIEVFENNHKMPFSFALKQFDDYSLAVCIQGILPHISYYETSISL